MLGRLILALLIAATPTLGLAQQRGTSRFDAVVVDGTLTAATVTTPSLKLGAFTLSGVGTVANTLAAGNDSRIVNAIQPSSLSAGLDTAFSSVRGSVLYRGSAGWVALAPGTSGQVLATGGASGDPSWVAQASGGSGVSSAALDSAFGSTQGSILYRSASAWTTLTPGTAGYLLQTGGAGANPSWVAPTTTNTPVPTRQTAISGPAASGAPTFLPSTTSGTLTLAAQNVSPSVPLIVTAAQGGLTNVITTFTSAPSWTLAASATNYLLVNASTGATIATTLAPIYQFGGTISTANGQFTFDWQAMAGYLGNGSTAVPTPIICLGEAVTSASAVTSTVAYAYQGRYQSAAVSFTTGTNYTFGHNVGVGPDQMETDIYSASASTGPWFPKAMSSNGSYFYPALQAPAGSASKQIIFQTGSSGVSLGFNAAATSGFLMLRVRRAW